MHSQHAYSCEFFSLSSEGGHVRGYWNKCVLFARFSEHCSQPAFYFFLLFFSLVARRSFCALISVSHLISALRALCSVRQCTSNFSSAHTQRRKRKAATERKSETQKKAKAKQNKARTARSSRERGEISDYSADLSRAFDVIFLGEAIIVLFVSGFFILIRQYCVFVLLLSAICVDHQNIASASNSDKTRAHCTAHTVCVCKMHSVLKIPSLPNARWNAVFSALIR